MPGQATTGLTPEQFDELIARIDKRIVWDRGRGRPKGLTLRQAVKATVMYFRTNVTEELIAELLFVDQSRSHERSAPWKGSSLRSSTSSSPTWPRKPTGGSG